MTLKSPIDSGLHSRIDGSGHNVLARYVRVAAGYVFEAGAGSLNALGALDSNEKVMETRVSGRRFGSAALLRAVAPGYSERSRRVTPSGDGGARPLACGRPR